MRALTVVGVILLLAGCDGGAGGSTGPDLFSLLETEGGVAGRYAYAGYDEKGVEIVTGSLTIVRDDSVRISGTWELKAKSGQPPYGFGPQVGSGELVGTLRGDRLSLGLNPDYVDNNVFLAGTCDRLRMTGRWEYVGFPGVLRHGTFSAVRFPLMGVQ